MLTALRTAGQVPTNRPPTVHVYPEPSPDGSGQRWMLEAAQQGQEWICALLGATTEPFESQARATIERLSRGRWTTPQQWERDTRHQLQPHYVGELQTLNPQTGTSTSH